jgi:quinoprotein glucose dehydrogenase
MTRHRRLAWFCVLLLAAVLPVLLRSQATRATRSFKTWSEYLGGADSSQYSALDQINKSNVASLQAAWTYSTGDTRGYRFNPIVVDGTMYVLAKNNSIVALDPATGTEKWQHRNEGAVTDRGMNYWESSDGSDRRLLYLNAGSLTAVDARTGNIIASFGDNGRVDVRTGLHRDLSRIRPLQTNNPGRIYQNLMIVSLPAGGPGFLASPGDIHAYDVRTGKLEWVFHTVPERGEFGADTWPDAALDTGSGVHNWAEFTVDEARGIVYIPTGTARYDFYGGNRHGANLFGNSILALDAKTGKRLWHFQTVHHDLWDYDLATSPKLLTVKHDGRDVDVVAQASKHGFLFVFDRVSGQPLWPIQERPVPQSDIPGEQTSPTQPFPTLPPPFARQTFTEQDINPYIPEEARLKFREKFRGYVNKGLFTPPSLQGSVQIPGNSGGANWGLSAVDPAKGTMYVMSKEAPSLLTLRVLKADAASATQAAQSSQSSQPADPDADPRGPDPRQMPPNLPAGFVPYGAFQPYGWNIEGLPPIGPPWSQLTAYDLNKGTILWQIPNGEVRDLAAKGTRDTGSQGARAGMVVTAGGLIFIGTPDHRLRAYDQDTGRVLWDKEMVGPINGVPAVYEISGREFVVVCVSPPGAPGRPGARAGTATPQSPGEYVAFALPNR